MYGQKKRVALLVVTLLLAFPLSKLANASTIAFRPPVSYPVGTNPGAVSVGDFNGDGKLDLAVVNHGLSDTGDDGGVSILLGNGDGTFQAARNFRAGKQPESIVIADFNSDGKADIIAVSETENVLNVLLGNGDGTFQPGVTVLLDIDPYFVVAGDFNNDHKMDLALSGLGRDLNGDGIRDSAGGTTVLLGNGDGTFQNHGALLPLSLSLAADFNQDSRLDLAVARFPGFDVFLGNGDGSFQAPTSTTLFDTTSIGVVDAAVDFNGDGKLDIVAVLPLHACGAFKFCDGQIEVLLGNGDGSFSSIFRSRTGGFFGTLAVGDFDADGSLDLAVKEGSDDANPVFRGDGKGNFIAAGTFAMSNTSGALHLLARDLNGDNLPDLVAAHTDNTITVQLNATPPDFLLDVSPANVPPVPAGGSATLTLTAIPQAGFSGDITLSCSSPTAQGVRCSFSPSSVIPGSSSTLTVTTTSRSAALAPPHSIMRFLYAFCLPTLGFGFAGFVFQTPRRRKGKQTHSVLFLFLFAGVLMQLACGGNSNANSGPRDTPVGNYSITITGTSGSTQHSTTTTLTVQ
jgi:hypothetical protein